MSGLPSTIKHPKTFEKSASASFDGVFDWSWTQGCFGGGIITPMDFDGVVERKGNFLVFETKNIGVPIPKGQMYTYESAYKIGVFTILFIEGKSSPEYAKAWCQPGFKKSLIMDKHAPTDPERMGRFVSDWYQFADNNPSSKIDITFLNKKITKLESSIERLREHAESIANELGGVIKWR